MDHLKIRKLLEWAKKIALFGHMHPDGDCLWSMLGLWALLEKQGKKVNYFTPTPPSKTFYFLAWMKKIKTEFDYAKYDLLVFVDFSAPNRIIEFFGWHEKYFADKPLLVIDHHLSDTLGHASIVKDINSMSTSEIIFEYCYTWRPKLFDAQIATYLYMWLTMDSWNFIYDEDHERILCNALHLVQLGADKWLIVDHLVRKKSLNLIRFTQLMLNRMVQTWDMIYSYYDDKDLKTYWVDEEEANYPLIVIQNIDGPKLVLILKKNGDRVRWSLRSKKVLWKKLIDCDAIAKKFNGGGHKPAAWFSIPVAGKFEDQVKKVVGQIQGILSAKF